LNERPRVSLRPAAESDREFLRSLFMSTREQELAALPGGAGAHAQLFNGQFSAQLHSYRHAFPRALDAIIEVLGMAVGRLYVDRAPGTLRLIDISLLPEYRGRGIGTALIRALLDEAAAVGGAVKLSVALSNPARILYQRLGFRTVSSDGIYLFLVAGITQTVAACH
jgi:ribosomal protein S18 acetylase RimI-like enzyme